MRDRLLVFVVIMTVITLVTIWCGKKPWRLAWLLPIAVPCFVIAQCRLLPLPDLWQGGFMIFGLLGSGLGLLGLTHLGSRKNV